MIGCHCPRCCSSDPRDHRTRPSVLISYNGCSVLVDAAPELRLQCLANGVEHIEAIAFTHAHADHIMGLDDVRRFNTLRGGQPLDVWADEATHNILGLAFGYAFRPPRHEPGVYRPHLTQRLISGPFEIQGVTWTAVPVFHGEAPILAYRIGRLAYCTDVSRMPDESFALLRDLDVLVIDALRFRPHPTHFSIEQAIEAAGRIGAAQTYFTHIAHDVLHESTSRSLPPGVQLGYDGLRVRARL